MVTVEAGYCETYKGSNEYTPFWIVTEYITVPSWISKGRFIHEKPVIKTSRVFSDLELEVITSGHTVFRNPNRLPIKEMEFSSISRDKWST